MKQPNTIKHYMSLIGKPVYYLDGIYIHKGIIQQFSVTGDNNFYSSYAIVYDTITEKDISMPFEMIFLTEQFLCDWLKQISHSLRKDRK